MKVQLIADSGSTKTAWSLLAPEPRQWQTPGINPFFQDGEEILAALRPHWPDNLPTIEAVHFYGSGVSTHTNQSRVEMALNGLAPEAQYYVDHDLLGAARAASGMQPGLVGILGTGCHCCYYSGRSVTDTALSLGFMLGDEGSGAIIGREVLAAYCKRHMPSDLAEEFAASHPESLPEILDRLYRQPYPNRYLASHARFALQRQEHPWCKQLLEQQFEAWFKAYVEPLAQKHQGPLHLVGSVAYYGKSILSASAAKRGLTLGQVLANPMEGLEHFHQNNTEA